MRDLDKIVADNGGDDTPALDTHNLTGRVVLDPDDAEYPLSYEEYTYAPLATFDELLDCE